MGQFRHSVEDVRLIAEAIAENRRKDALELLKDMFPRAFEEIPEPHALMRLADESGRAIA